MKIEVIFSEAPTVTQFAQLIGKVGDIWPESTITEPTRDLHIYIDCHEREAET